MTELQKKLFVNTLLDKNGYIVRKNREWVEIAGSLVAVIGIAITMILALIVL